MSVTSETCAYGRTNERKDGRMNGQTTFSQLKVIKEKREEKKHKSEKAIEIELLCITIQNVKEH